MKTRKNNIEIVSVQFKALPGADIYSCINECISFSAKNETPCTLIHNGAKVTISASDLCNKIQKEWDKELQNVCKNTNNK